MNKIDIAEKNFKNGCNCAQSVLLAFANQKLPSEELMLLSSCFGGGILQQGKVCGVVTGAIMALGLNKGYTLNNKETQKSKLIDLGNEFIKEFKHKHGTIDCKELIKFDLSIPGEKQKANDLGIFKELCPQYVKTSALILSKVLGD